MAGPRIPFFLRIPSLRKYSHAPGDARQDEYTNDKRNAAKGQPLDLPRELTVNGNYTPHRRRLTGTIHVDKMDVPWLTATARAQASPHDATATVSVAYADWSISNPRTRSWLRARKAVPQVCAALYVGHRPQIRCIFVIKIIYSTLSEFDRRLKIFQR